MWKDLIRIFKGDDLYTKALHECYQMLDMDLQMYQASVETLRYTEGTDLKIDVYGLDKQINAFERDVRKKVMTHLAVSGPGNLTSGLVLISIVIDIERIGDYAKNITDLARSHPARLHGGSIEEQVHHIEQMVTTLFNDTVEAFRRDDVEKSRDLMELYKGQISAACDEVVDWLVSGKVTDLAPNDAAAIALYVRYLKRIGAHSRNIMTSVVNPFHRIGYREKRENG